MLIILCLSWAQLHSLPSSALFCDSGLWPQWTASHSFPTGFSQWEALAGIEVGAERGYCHSSHSSSGRISNKGCFSLWPQHPSGDPSSTSSFYLVTTLFYSFWLRGNSSEVYIKRPECNMSTPLASTPREQEMWVLENNLDGTRKQAAKSEL